MSSWDLAAVLKVRISISFPIFPLYHDSQKKMCQLHGPIYIEELPLAPQFVSFSY